jgi:hypothetical protein
MVILWLSTHEPCISHDTWALQKLTHGPQTFTEKILTFRKFTHSLKIYGKFPQKSIHDPCILTIKYPKILEN